MTSIQQLLFGVGVGAGPEPGRFAPFSGRHWIERVTVAEALGFAIPGTIWGLVWLAGLPSLLAYACVVLAGAGEGAVLGWAQASVLRRSLPGISRPWVTATASGAMFAWALGMAPSTAADLGASNRLTIVLAVVVALPLLLSIGVAQWTVLRSRRPRASRWIAASAFAWLAGLPVTFVAPALVPNDAPWWAFAVAFALAGIAMAAAVAFITGAAMKRLL